MVAHFGNGAGVDSPASKLAADPFSNALDDDDNDEDAMLVLFPWR
jgi:hypothetical protein